MIWIVRKADFPFLADWFAISFRWFGLLGSTIALAVAKELNWYAIVVLVVSALWNIGMSILAMLNHRLQFHRIINIVIDCLVSILLFSITGGITGPLGWISLISILSAAIYYEWRGSVFISLILIVAELSIIYLTNNDIFYNLVPIHIAYSLQPCFRSKPGVGKQTINEWIAEEIITIRLTKDLKWNKMPKLMNVIVCRLFTN